jgi:hypothetical protein
VIATQTMEKQMTMVEIGRRQWQGYAHYHQSRSNLLLHAAVVPVFLAGNIGLVLALLLADGGLGFIAAAATAASLAVQSLRASARTVAAGAVHRRRQRDRANRARTMGHVPVLRAVGAMASRMAFERRHASDVR